MKKQIILVITILIVLISFSIVNAAMLENIQLLQGKNCSLIENDYVSSPVKSQLISKFGLTSNPNADCSFVLDYVPYSQQTLDLVFFNDPEYAEINYKVNGTHKYLFLLGKNYTALDKIVNLTANYEKYQYYLKVYDDQYPYYFSYGIGDISLIPEYFWNYYDPTYTGPKNQGCVDNLVESIYLGNQGSYQNSGTVQFSSSCTNSNTIYYPFCVANSFVDFPYSCKCVAGKCIATPNDLFYYFNLKGNYVGPLGRIIDNKLISSAVKSWIEN